MKQKAKVIKFNTWTPISTITCASLLYCLAFNYHFSEEPQEARQIMSPIFLVKRQNKRKLTVTTPVRRAKEGFAVRIWSPGEPISGVDWITSHSWDWRKKKTAWVSSVCFLPLSCMIHFGRLFFKMSKHLIHGIASHSLFGILFKCQKIICGTKL